MDILIDSGSYHCLNVGDVAMLQAAIERLRDLWPHASIAAVTNAPGTLARHCPGVQPVPLAGRVAFLSDRLLGRADPFLPHALRETLSGVERRMRRDWPLGLASFVAAKRALVCRPDYAAPRTYIAALLRADLVVATGAGVFTDAFADNAFGVLTTLELAQKRRIPTALMGHGLGPVGDATLKQRMAEVLPQVDLVGLREHSESARLLESLNVSSDRVVVTGDDAIEMANRCARPEPGGVIGVNIRVSGYAGVDRRAIDVIRPAVRRAAARLAAPLVPIPIAHHPDCHDGVAICELLTADVAEPMTPAELDTPLAAITEVSRCRVMVTGSYHAAVFALAQGIPAVAIAATPYYAQKFSGLAALFPSGCEIVALDQPDASRRLESAMCRAWTNAPRLRPHLLRAADAQIAQGRAAYRRLGVLAEASCAGAPALSEIRRYSASIPSGRESWTE